MHHDTACGDEKDGVYLALTLSAFLNSPQGKESMPNKIQAQERRALWLANLIEKEIDVAGLVGNVISIESHF